jgi:hypothetical protein
VLAVLAAFVVAPLWGRSRTRQEATR